MDAGHFPCEKLTHPEIPPPPNLRTHPREKFLPGASRASLPNVYGRSVHLRLQTWHCWSCAGNHQWFRGDRRRARTICSPRHNNWLPSLSAKDATHSRSIYFKIQPSKASACMTS